MVTLRVLLAILVARDEGQALVEYGLLLALIGMAAIIGMTVMGSNVDGLWTTAQRAATAMADALSR